MYESIQKRLIKELDEVKISGRFKNERIINSVQQSEITVNNMFTPLVDHLQENVQNPEHIIPEDALSGWTRGGNPSRLLVRDVSYLEKCGYKYMDRQNASGFWKDKHMYL